MFDGFGFFEMLVVVVLGLIVLGPERLPVAVRTVSGWVRTIKRMAGSVRTELEQELKIEQLQADLKKAEAKGLKDLDPGLQQSIQELREAAQSVNRPYAESDAQAPAAEPAPATADNETKPAAAAPAAAPAESKPKE
ncbi:twin-arginine translocation protein, TatB subunit [Ferrimonas balearica DSM 9799]|uniref:Sec-independent protein translocase protein TatB n=1 Tax=Ferrimonas balearica (strain DSM 9799 / CCM 4581 / KCTC 23876 / PAT) TaxID=550540 RepID=E1SNU1_FERBD|nr:Sec-independent protein translocase protein TatB [Ferrimonas balearica]ADN77748.1 twin-arginine translocation protein, TatB subunit [Ferrimonas balearica DSM 9799]MBW3165911.1 Sec-independent protein translocase protein TatB [Ferrimonas balearica]MBY5981822.1 Sec-independent protein translocase protein TatB [Ferrimonas balearica]